MATKPTITADSLQPGDTTHDGTSTPSAAHEFRDFLAWERKTKDAVDFKTIYVDMTGNLHAGLLLSQIVYWHLPQGQDSHGTKLRIRKEGRWWLAKADADWWAEVRLSSKQARDARRIIEERGLITCKTMRFSGNPTTHISINMGEFLTAWAKIMAIPVDVRDRGWIEGSKAKRVGAKRPGSKPASGNRTPRKRFGELSPVGDKRGDVHADLTPKNDELQGAHHYSKGNNGITEKAIRKLLKSQDAGYPKLNNLVPKTVISLTESKAKTTSETFSEKRGGGLLDASGSKKTHSERPTKFQSPPAVIAQRENTTTTENAALQTDTASVKQGSVAHSPINAPQGAYSAPSELRSAAPRERERQHVNDSSLENVPPGPAVIDLCPEQDHNPQHIRTILEIRLGGPSKLNSLMDELPPAVFRANTTRKQWLAIPKQRIDKILAEASEDKAQKPWTAIISRLDREIGANITQSAGRQVTQTANGGATTLLKPGASKVPVDSDNAMNAFLGFWELKADPKTLVNVVRTTTATGKEIVLENGETLSSAHLVIKYSRQKHAVNESESDSVEEVGEGSKLSMSELN